VHIVSDGNGVPLGALLLPGQAHESTQFESLLETIEVHQARGRPRKRPRRIGADKAYHAQRIRHWLRAHGIGAVIPVRGRRVKRQSGRPVSFDRRRYRDRNVIERGIGWLKECRSLATRFEKLALHYLGMVQLAIIQRYLRLLAPEMA
jgi:transposase